MIVNGLSFDVEEHFHALNLRSVAPMERWEGLERRVAATTRAIVERLATHGVKATFFFLGWVAQRDKQLVRDVYAAGHEIGSHGMSHKMAGELGPAEFRAEARASKAVLEDAISARISGFRASTFSITEKTSFAFEILKEEGYDYDSSVFPVRHDRYGWPTFARVPCFIATPAGTLTELPMLTLRRFGTNLPAAGGGYLRMLPLSLMHRALDSMNQDGAPGVLYLHPWEFDPGQPRMLKGGLAAFRHYYGLGNTMAKLERLLVRHRFGPLAPIAASVLHTGAPAVTISAAPSA